MHITSCIIGLFQNLGYSICIYRNNVILRNCVANRAHIINLTVNMFDDVRYHNNSSGVFVQYCKVLKRIPKSIWKPLPEDWIKLNVDASRRHAIRLISLGYIMRDNQAKIIMTKWEQIENCLILVVKCSVAREAITTTIQNQKIIIEID